MPHDRESLAYRQKYQADLQIPPMVLVQPCPLPSDALFVHINGIFTIWGRPQGCAARFCVARIMQRRETGGSLRQVTGKMAVLQAFVIADSIGAVA